MNCDKLKILAIDDEKSFLEALRSALGKTFARLEFFTALNGAGGIELALAEDPDLIMLDVIMPGMNGFETCRRLKADPRLANIPVLFLTAMEADSSTYVNALEAGGEAFLLKPPELGQLLFQVRAMAKLKAAALFQLKETERLETLVAERTRKLEAELAGRGRIENELKLSEQKYRNLAENCPDLVWELDENGNYAYVSPKLKELLGYDAAEVIGKDPFEFICAEEEEEEAEELRRALLKKTPFGNIGHCGRHKDGRRRLLETSGNPFFDETGRYRGCRGLTRDITERRRLEDENRIKAQLLDSIKDAVFLHDPEGRIVYANEAACVLAGCAGDSLGDMLFQKLLAPESAENFAGQTRLTLQLGKAVFEAEHLRPDGGLLPVETRAHALELDGEKFILRVASDITERKEAECAQQRLLRELESTNSEISQFNGLIAHDLQLPLRLVRSYARLLEKRLAGKLDPAGKEFLGYIVNGGGLMQEMLDGLLLYLREGAKPEAMRKVDMDKVAGQALLLLKPAIEENQASVSCGRLPEVVADRAQMIRLLQNLVGNAVKFRGLEAPRVSVSCADEGTCHLFTVRDNGIGIPPQSLERIFKIFQRLHTREEYPGTGLGLALCRKIVENHGGRIWAESGPGKGAAFHFTLPRRDKAPGPEERKNETR